MSVNLWRRVAEDALALISSAGKRLSRSTPQELRIQSQVGDGQPRIGAHGKPVLFFHPKDFSGALVEIEQA